MESDRERIENEHTQSKERKKVQKDRARRREREGTSHLEDRSDASPTKRTHASKVKEKVNNENKTSKVRKKQQT